jgi:DNA polymerase III alpha subunit
MDIDIDFFDRNTILSILPHIIAMRKQNSDMVKHNTGVYFQEIPHNPFDNISTVDYKEAESRGYFKLDFLNVSAYKGIIDEQHLQKLLDQEPIWELLEHRDIVEQLFHIKNHYDIVKKLKPKNIEQLAAVLAIIRPAKRHLLNCDWKTIEQEVWKTEPTDTYRFKKSHSISYAHLIVVQLNMLCEQLINVDE